MKNGKILKQHIISYLIDLIDQRIDTFKVAVQNARESRDNDTKSSMGDKYETSRSMVQMEIEKLRKQLDQNIFQKDELNRINLNEKHTKVQHGSLVYTNRGLYFLSVGWGKLDIKEDMTCYCISIVSPLGQAMVGKGAGEEFLFQERDMLIERVV